MNQIIEYLMLLKLIQQNIVNKEEVVTTISEEKETPVIIATISIGTISSPSEKSIMGDIIDEAFKIIDKEYRLIYCQWAVCIYKLDKCEVWGLVPARYTEGRSKKYLYSDSIIKTKSKFFYFKEHIKEEDIEYNTLKDLRNYVIGMISGYFYQQKIMENIQLPLIKWFTNEETLLQGLINGIVQIAPMTEVWCRRICRSE